MFDILEVLFFHTKKLRDQSGRLQDPLTALQSALGADFEVEPHEYVGASGLDSSRQIVRIAATTTEYTSAQEFEIRVRELADAETFPWQRIGAVPVGQTETVLS
ncbi:MULTISPECIES: hypothetical protein [Ralstonia]|uniref:hypothetical protein n=1 Tax=Ralstonia TaxID=48736 RepID=UPI000386233B|nr:MULTISPECIES: hypothetical protein [Ralstonia]EPX96161.1 hypothetical protein C404_20090 [Ralstonia sp. AU12-08]